MTTVYHSLSSKTNSVGESQILLQVYATRKIRLRGRSGIFISQKCWSTKCSKILTPKSTPSDTGELSKKVKRLNDLTVAITTAIDFCKKKDRIDKKWLMKFIDDFHKPKRKRHKSIITERGERLIPIIEKYLTDNFLSDSRQKHFNSIARSLKRYESYREIMGHKNYCLSIDNLTKEDLKEIEWFLANEKNIYDKYPEIYEKVPMNKRKRHMNNKPMQGKCPRVRGINTVIDMMKRIKTVLGWAYNSGLTNNNTFRLYHISEAIYLDPIYLSVEEIKMLYKADLSDTPNLAIQRDIFVLQSMIGCRIGDYYCMTMKDIIDIAIEYIPSKSIVLNQARALRIPLTPTALEIIDRYKDPDRDSIAPFISHQAYNDSIKQAFRKAGLNRKVIVLDQITHKPVHKHLYEVASSHMARKTFIGNIYKNVSDQNLVSELTGHKPGSKAFVRYRNVSDEMKRVLISYLE